MYDIKFIRAFPELFDRAMKARFIDNVNSDIILALDNKIRTNVTSIQELQKKRNDMAALIGKLKSQNNPNNENLENLMKESEKIKESIFVIEQDNRIHEDKMNNYLITLPNIPDNDVPLGPNEESNLEIKKFKEPKKFEFEPKQHFDLGEDLGKMDFKNAVKISGSRFVILSDELAQMERALANFMLDIHTKQFGYREFSIPQLVTNESMFNTGQLPKLDQDSFTVNDKEYRLIPTSEIPLVNIVADSVLNNEELPLRFTAYSQCFRSEAGSAGKDTRGMIRLHQFSKVELVSITENDKSEAEHERMLNAAEQVLKLLEIPYRVMLLSSGDMGFCAAKTYDIEVWLPGQNKYREISSCSNCRNFQAVRSKIRYKNKSTGKNDFAHTLNGSGVAIGRTIIAILENYQNSDGSVSIPNALRPYMGMIDRINKK